MVIYLHSFSLDNKLNKTKMRKNKLNVLARIFTLLIVMSVFSSCAKKGVGCPNNFKVFPSITVPFTK